MITLCGVRAIGRSRWTDECGRSGVIIDRHGTPLCHEHAYLADRSETPNENIKHIAWLMRDILEADGEMTKVQVEQGDIDSEYWIEDVCTWADGLVIRLGNAEMYELMLARIDPNTT